MSDTANSALDLEPFRSAGRALDALSNAGWVVQDVIGDVRATLTTHNLSGALVGLAPLQPAIGDVEAVGELDGHEIRLRMFGGVLEVVSLPAVDPHSLFDAGEDLENALRTWDRDTAAAQLLPLVWRVTAYLSVRGLVPASAEIDVRMAVDPNTIVTSFTAASLPALNRLVPATGARRVYLSLRGAAAPVHLGTFSLVASGATSPVLLPLPAIPPPGEAAAAQQGVALPSPYTLIPLAPTFGPLAEWEPAVRRCVAAAAASTWALLASRAELTGDTVSLDFLGFKRIRLALPDVKEMEPNSVAAVLELRAWALQDTSPDRLLAVRQVVSLYERDDAFGHARDIRASAEIIYVGLRSDAVAEVVKSSRDAQALANDTVRQALKSSQDLVKAATERFLAGLVAIGAVVIANASNNLSDDVSRNLLLLLAGFFGVLAIVAVFVEGPLLSLQMKYLAADLRAGSSLLTEQQRQAIVDGASAQATRERIRVVRASVPVLHVALAIAILLWVYPANFG
ncbi:MAG: hypothetical protein ABI899_09685 [Actinomycetota bacterium]